ncbi:MAG: hypothetical protein AAGA18_14140 [Verrucomicrobiota bacterium]
MREHTHIWLILLGATAVIGAAIVVYQLKEDYNNLESPPFASNLKDKESHNPPHSLDESSALQKQLSRLLDVQLLNRSRIEEIILSAAREDYEATKAWIEEHLESAKLQLALNILYEFAADRTLEEVIKSMQDNEMSFSEALSQLKNSPGLSHSQQKELVARWGQVDPQAVAQSLLTLAEDDTDGLTQYDLLMPSLVPGLGEQEFADTYALINTVEGESRSEIISTFLALYALQNPTLALDTILEAPDFEDRQGFADSILKEWAKKDLQAAYDWAQNLPQEQRAPSTLITVGKLLAQESPDVAAAAITAGELPTDPALIRKVAHHWATEDDQSLEDWVNTLVDYEMRNQAVLGWSENLMESYDPDTIFDFYDQYYEGEDKNEKWLLVVSYGARQGKISKAAESFQKADLGQVNPNRVKSTLRYIVASWAVYGKGEDLMAWIDEVTNHEPNLTSMNSNLKNFASRTWQDYHDAKDPPSWSE